ncbi:putative hydro-lyase [Gemmobacter sp.]|uniref:putative hydro-lyase n=1 Tax=Gemmobacter sp. TaxID=1898957 RepID=UPI002AFF84D5|nr:putative hydro-lyase [Gemmobacter sp.]
MTHPNTPPATAYPDGVSVRRAARSGVLRAPTSGMAQGFEQGNLVILHADDADDFLRFCVANPKAAPILDVSEPGSFHLPRLGADLDIRSDIPRYRVFRDGVLAEQPTDIAALWQDDFVTFVLGCSFTFESALVRAGIPVRHMDNGTNVPMYITNVDTIASGKFGGPMVMSMRPFTPRDAITATVLSSQLSQAHGAPLHIGAPEAIGIADIHKPDFGDPPDIRDGEIPVFWACGVTPQAAIMRARLRLAITHEPGHMLVTDLNCDAGRQF